MTEVNSISLQDGGIDVYGGGLYSVSLGDNEGLLNMYATSYEGQEMMMPLYAGVDGFMSVSDKVRLRLGVQGRYQILSTKEVYETSGNFESAPSVSDLEVGDSFHTNDDYLYTSQFRRFEPAGRVGLDYNLGTHEGIRVQWTPTITVAFNKMKLQRTTTQNFATYTGSETITEEHEGAPFNGWECVLMPWLCPLYDLFTDEEYTTTQTTDYFDYDAQTGASQSFERVGATIDIKPLSFQVGRFQMYWGASLLTNPLIKETGAKSPVWMLTSGFEVHRF